MKKNHLPKNAAFHHEKLKVLTNSNNPDEHAGYGSLRVFVKVNGCAYTKTSARREHSFLLKQGLIDERWEVIKWGNGFAVAPATNLCPNEE
jgi:hypothetical protein